ncbi:Hypothetical_protein [Hexamita inflata]|uniref:Hypothetical_protein n=1 Tax=Hexamita inflata TaxID=28002 RepID=A0AA86TZ51_9EUKA|nr:Hypothetical protein HINF_LOCUS23100 [Hexamita inflata]
MLYITLFLIEYLGDKVILYFWSIIGLCCGESEQCKQTQIKTAAEFPFLVKKQKIDEFCELCRVKYLLAQTFQLGANKISVDCQSLNRPLKIPYFYQNVRFYEVA